MKENLVYLLGAILILVCSFVIIPLLMCWALNTIFPLFGLAAGWTYWKALALYILLAIVSAAFKKSK
jgi:hypothetical protein